MGQEVSKEQMPEGRSRSLSPLPRDDPFDDLPPFPSTMPAYTDMLRPLPPPPPGRRARSRGLSPDEGRLNASQPALSAPNSELAEQLPRPASQPELSNAKKIRPLKRRSSGVKSKTKQEDEAVNGIPAGEDATLVDEARSKKRGKRTSILDHLDKPEPAAVVGDMVPIQDRSPQQDTQIKNSKRKGKEVVRDVVDRSIFDFDDEPPPSVQPLAKRSRRDSNSKARKKRKTPQPSDEGSSVRAKAESSDEAEGISREISPQHSFRSSGIRRSTPTPRLNNSNFPASPVDNIKAEQDEEDKLLGGTQSQQSERSAPQRNGSASSRPLRASAASSQRSQAATRHAKPNGHVSPEPVVKDEPGMDLDTPDGQVTSGPAVKDETGMDVDVPDGLPRHQDSFVNAMSAVSEPHGLPVRDAEALDASKLASNETEQRSIETENTVDAVSAQDDSVIGTDNKIFRIPSFVGEDESASDRDTTATGTTIHNRDNGESAMARSPTPVMTIAETAATPPASSARSHTSKRKAKLPFFPHENKENANAFSELPLDDVAAQPRPKRVKVSPSPVEAEAGSSRVTNPPKSNKPRKQKVKEPAVVDAATNDSDDEAPAERRYRSGALSGTEQNQIVRAVERFREDESMTQQEINQIIHDNPQKNAKAIHRQLWGAIQDACPLRPRQKLINWCRQRFHNFAGRGVWTREQDDELARLVEIHGKKWSHISGLINRHQKDARDRWRNYLVCRDTVKSDTWSEDEEERLRDLVEAAIEKIQEGSSQNTTKPPEDLINWAKISEAMGHTRSRLQCSTKWKDLCANEPIPGKAPTVLPSGSSWRLRKARKDLRKMTLQDKYDLMLAIRDSGVGTDSKINWKPIVSRTFQGKYERQAVVVVWGRLRHAVPDWEWKTTRDCARYLCEMYEREGNFGAAEPEGAEESEGNLSEEVPASSTDPRGKGKGVLRQHLAGTSKKDAAKDNTLESGESSSKLSRAASNKKQLHRDERESSPELGGQSPQPSPSVEVQATRTKRREKRESTESIGEKPGGKGKEKKVQPPTPKMKAQVSKRPRHESLSNGDVRSHKPKKRKTGKSSSATAGGKALSIISSDMDDMEDIPATLPTSSQAAY